MVPIVFGRQLLDLSLFISILVFIDYHPKSIMVYLNIFVLNFSQIFRNPGQNLQVEYRQKFCISFLR